MNASIGGRSVWKVLAAIGTPVAAFLFVGAVVMGTSRAAFFDTTDNSSNSLTAGDVVISDDDAGSALFSVGNMAPGDTVTKCINVQYDGSIVPAGVDLYVADGGLGGTGLGAYLNLTVELGTGGTFADCTGFSGSSVYTGTLAGFAADHTDFATGTGSWAASSTGDDRTYRFTLELQDDNDAQNLGASVAFTWEAQNQ